MVAQNNTSKSNTLSRVSGLIPSNERILRRIVLYRAHVLIRAKDRSNSVKLAKGMRDVFNDARKKKLINLDSDKYSL